MKPDDEFTAAEKAWLAKTKERYLQDNPAVRLEWERDEAIMAKPRDQLTWEEHHQHNYLRHHPNGLEREQRYDEELRDFLRQHPHLREHWFKKSKTA